MFVKVFSMSVIGMESYPVSVEVDISQGLPQFATVGLPDASVKESRDRIKAAIKNSGYRFPRSHVIVNLAPADIKKEGTGFDLPIAVGILAAEELIKETALHDCFFIGELSLDGSIKGVSGVLTAAFKAKEIGIKSVFVPEENAAEAAMVEGINVFPVKTLPDVVEFFNGRNNIEPLSLDVSKIFQKTRQYEVDFNEIKGQKQALRALEIAAAGRPQCAHIISYLNDPIFQPLFYDNRRLKILHKLFFHFAFHSKFVEPFLLYQNPFQVAIFSLDE